MAKYDVTKLGTALEFDTTNANGFNSIKVPGKDWIAVAWFQSTSILYVQILSINTSTGALTAVGSPVDIETGTSASDSYKPSIVAIDGSNLAVFWTSVSSRGYTRLLSIDGSGNVSTNGTQLVYDNDFGYAPSAVLVDSTHILNTWGWRTSDNRVYACIFTVNTGTGSITKTGTQLRLNSSGDGTNGISVAMLTSDKAIVGYSEANGRYAYLRVVSINTSTWAVTTAGAEFRVDTGNSNIYPNITDIYPISSSVAIIHRLQSNSNIGGYVRTVDINNTTWEISHKGADLQLSNRDYIAGQVQKVDDDTYIASHGSKNNDRGRASTIGYNSGNGNLTILNTLEFDTANCYRQRLQNVGNYKYVTVYQGDGSDGFAVTLEVEMSSPSTGNFFHFF